MKVHFIGAGPGAADLITLRGLNLIKKCKLCLYAGSLVPQEIIDHAPNDATIIDTAPMTLEEIMAEIKQAQTANIDVSRVHSGDPSLYGAIAEQIRLLEEMGIDYDITPGVSAYAAAAAELKCELTLPEISQTIILTRTAMKSSEMPKGEELENLAKTKATLAIHLSIRNIPYLERALIPHYGEDCPVAVVYRATWPDQLILQGTLSDIRQKVRAAKLTRTAIILVGHVLDSQNFRNSALYDKNHQHILRYAKK